MAFDEIKTTRDVQADEHNQWGSLGEDEKVEMSVFKVGDKVWSNVMGDGVVCMISADGSYPVCVKFNECTDIQRYTTEGKWYEWDKEPEIFLKGV